MRKGILAMEDIVEVLPEHSTVDSVILAIDGAVADVAAHSDQIDEAEQIGQVVDGIGEQLSSSPEGVSEETAKMAEVVLEHFCARLGYGSKVFPAFESFSAGGAKTATALAVEQLTDFREKLDYSVSVAQEGFFEKVGTAFMMTFAGAETAATKIKDAAAKYKENGPREGNIHSPAWGKYLYGGSGVYKGSDAVSALKKFNSAASSEKLIGIVHEMNSILGRLTKEVRGNWFVSNKEDIHRIETLGNTVVSLGEKVDLRTGVDRTKAVEFEPMSENDVKRLSDIANELLDNRRLENEIDKFHDKAGNLSSWSALNMFIRPEGIAGLATAAALGGGGAVFGGVAGQVAGTAAAGVLGLSRILMPEDIKKAQDVQRAIRRIIREIVEMISERAKLATAAAYYIRASAK